MNNHDYIVLTHKQNSLVCEFILKKRFFDGIIENSNYHFHSLFEVHVCVAGNMQISVEDKDILLSPGEICIIPPHKTHYISSDENSCGTGLRFTFSNSGKTKSEESMLFENTYGKLCNAVVIKNPNVYGKYLSVSSENIKNKKPDFISANLIFVALCEIAGALTDTICRSNSVAYSDIAVSESIEDYINLNYNNKISLEDIAAQLNLGKRQTQRIINNLFGMTFTELLNKKRLTAAKLLLKTTDKSVEEIAYLCGFEDKNYFYRRFSAMFGTTPGKYRLNIAISKNI